MGEWWAKVCTHTKKEFSSWTTKGFFSLALAGIIWTFSKMDWPSFLALLLCIGVAIFTGTMIVQRMAREIRGSPRKNMTPDQLEAARKKRVCKLFRKFIKEAKGGKNWGAREFGDWVAKVECLLCPLVPDELASFEKLFGRFPNISLPAAASLGLLGISIDQKRQECLTWLEAMLLRYWS